ncbi:MAG: hypothetical protein J6D02_04950 [Lachnospira sp.]|nr:hypothetical protein [Lachnospira sp.]
MVEEDGTTTTRYVYGNELISAKTYGKSLEELKDDGVKATASTTYYYHYDNLKSTTLLTDATGEVVETYDYGTYGEVTSGDTILTRFLYNGGLGVSSDSNGLYYMRARYYNPTIRRFINQDVKAGSMNDSASLNRYAYVQGNPISLTDPFGLSPDMEYGNYEANALKRLFKVADKVADYLPVVGTARDIKRSYNAFKNGNIADGIKHGATAALALAGSAAKVMKSAMKLAKNSLKAEKCLSKIAQIASEGIKLAGKAVRRVGDAGKKVAKTVKNGVSAVARTVKKNAAKVFKSEKRSIRGKYKDDVLSIPTQQQMHDAVIEWARMEKNLAPSKGKITGFNTASVVFDARTGEYYYGMNKGIKLSGDDVNKTLADILPPNTLNRYEVGNCAEVDAVNQALNNNSNLRDLYIYTINVTTDKYKIPSPDFGIPKPACENCTYTFRGKVADIISGYIDD